jgi:Alpha-kinase family
LHLAFRFHTEGAILGKLMTDPESNPLACLHFIASPLLPCSKLDGPVQKFTGNDDCGNPPAKGDKLTMAIHAFAHFVVQYSRQNLLLCDLQGEWNCQSNRTALINLGLGLFDNKNTMCLFDPQSHTYV